MTRALITVAGVCAFFCICSSPWRFPQSYFQQLSLDLLVGATFLTSLFNKAIVRNDWRTKHLYLTSYSVDSNNPYAAPVTTTLNYSGYFLPVWNEFVFRATAFRMK